MADDNDNNETGIELEDLSDEQKATILQNPDVLKSVRYESDAVQDASEGLNDLITADEESEEEEAYDLLVSGIADRSGRVTEQTVKKVLSGLTEEVQEVTHSE